MTDKQLLIDCLEFVLARAGYGDAVGLPKRLRAALAEQGTAAEPVAWGVFDSDDELLEVKRTREAAESWLQCDGARIVVPLYTHPPQQQARVTVTEEICIAACKANMHELATPSAVEVKHMRKSLEAVLPMLAGGAK